jgi:hypothetical protein
MNQDLENMIRRKGLSKFKSEGERRIARFLEGNSIKYQYEQGVLINAYENKPRIWYPDFHLPEFEVYIEFFGLVGRLDYDRGVKFKESMYSKMGLEVIPVYPWMFAENWKGYIMKELKQTTIQRYKNLMGKKYWSQNRPPLYRHVNQPRRAYYQGVGKRY